MVTPPFEPYEGVSEEISKVIYDHAMQPQTSVSLQALMRTGKGEFLHKTFEDTKMNNDEHSASELVLIQVCHVDVCTVVLCVWYCGMKDKSSLVVVVPSI